MKHCALLVVVLAVACRGDARREPAQTSSEPAASQLSKPGDAVSPPKPVSPSRPGDVVSPPGDVASKPGDVGSPKPSDVAPPPKPAKAGDVAPPKPSDVAPPPKPAKAGDVGSPKAGDVGSPKAGDIGSPKAGDVGSPKPGDLAPSKPSDVAPPKPSDVAPPKPNDVVAPGPTDRSPDGSPPAEPTWAAARELCVTKGDVTRDAARTTIAAPATRGFARASSGDAASLQFTYAGLSEQTVSLASGDVRSQVGLKLRAEDSCNLIYVMWRVAPKPEVVVQVKRNPGKTTHEACGAGGYVRIKAAKRAKLAAPEPGSSHVLAAQIDHNELFVWADHKLVWRGPLPEVAHDLKGNVGFRTDNVNVELSLFAGAADSTAACPKTRGED